MNPYPNANLATYLQGKDLMGHPENMREKSGDTPRKNERMSPKNQWLESMHFLLK